ncbi:MAG: PLP-dependent aminotransferase family protein [Burkholderiales bacterium]
MFGLTIDKASSVSLTSQLARQLREAILCGKIEAGAKMPPTRSLAKELGVSRNTVVQTYEQLIAEGYLNSVTGSGTFAADIGAPPKLKKQTLEAAHEYGREKDKDVIAFYAGNPDVSSFPRTLWGKALKEACLYAEDDAFGYGRPEGHPDLRKAIQGYLYRAKGIYCGSDRIIILPGTAMAIQTVAQLLYREGCAAAFEDPCIDFAPGAIKRGGLKTIPVESDSLGMRTDLLPADANIRLVYVAPSHQYPLGGVMPIARRLKLLEFAQRHDAYIIEDDYDSEFRYHGEPIQSLWNLGDERVIYLGSFSNVFSPSLRMAYIIIPERLKKSMSVLLGRLNIWVGAIEQIALGRIIESKQYDRHVYRMKRLYDSKRKLLIDCLKAAFGSRIQISGELAGLHMLVTLDRDITEEDKKAIAESGVEVDYAEDYAAVKGRFKNKLVLGYGNLGKAQIEEGVLRLKNALK